MSEMTIKEALDSVETALANLNMSLPAHIQVKQVIAQVRKQAADSVSPPVSDEEQTVSEPDEE